MVMSSISMKAQQIAESKSLASVLLPSNPPVVITATNKSRLRTLQVQVQEAHWQLWKILFSA